MKATKLNRPGRPPKGSDQVKGIRLDMRIMPTEKQGFKAAATLGDSSLADTRVVNCFKYVDL